MGEMPREVRDLLCDPQTSGGLLAVMPEDQKMKIKLQPPSLALN